jgi:hypothetical protein
MPWYYVCEMPDLSQDWGKRMFGNDFARIARLNVTGGTSEPLTSRTRRIIEDKNTLDRALHDFAARKLRRAMRRSRAKQFFGALFRPAPPRTTLC